jgi:hypothetical protein
MLVGGSLSGSAEWTANISDRLGASGQGDPRALSATSPRSR